VAEPLKEQKLSRAQQKLVNQAVRAALMGDVERLEELAAQGVDFSASGELRCGRC
jgi:hypothetical protein